MLTALRARDIFTKADSRVSQSQDDGHFHVFCRYVERNAQRAGLVERAEDWRWGSTGPRIDATSTRTPEKEAHFNRPTIQKVLAPFLCWSLFFVSAATRINRPQRLKQRGMLEDTLVVWGGAFGRTIYCQGKLTDKVNVVENPVHVHDLQATILKQLGIDHERLT